MDARSLYTLPRRPVLAYAAVHTLRTHSGAVARAGRRSRNRLWFIADNLLQYPPKRRDVLLLRLTNIKLCKARFVRRDRSKSKACSTTSRAPGRAYRTVARG